MELVVATTNQGKFQEIQNALKHLPIQLHSLNEFKSVPVITEDQQTFEANALKKAREMHRFLKKPVLADDSGLVVEGLSGRPGVHSARYAGEKASDEENRKKLLHEMKAMRGDQRKSFFVCQMVLIDQEGREVFFCGTCEGEIALSPRGGLGFGYDPIFFIPSLQKTMAELALEEKNKISHRGKALSQLITYLERRVL